MYLNVSTVKDVRGASVQDSADESIDLQLPGGAELVGPVSIKAMATFAGDAFHVSGRVSGRFRATCDRCLADFTAPIDADFEGDYVRTASHQPARVNDDDDPESDEGTRSFSGDQINVTPLARESLLLVMPMKYLCRPDCEGLCPKCGNPKSGGCGCSETALNPDFEALRKFLGKEEV